MSPTIPALRSWALSLFVLAAACEDPTNLQQSTESSFDLDVSPAFLTARTGSVAETSVRLTPKFRFSGNVDVFTEGFSSGVTAIPRTIRIGTERASTVLRLEIDRTVPQGTYEGRVVAVSGSVRKVFPIVLQVPSANQAFPDFTLSASPAQVSLTAGMSTEVTVTMTRIENFNEAIFVTLADAPSGVTAPMVPIASGSDSVTLVISAAPGMGSTAAVANIVGSATALMRSTPLTVSVGGGASLPPRLDATFGSEGVANSLSTQGYTITQLVAQPDGKALLAGIFESPQGEVLGFLARTTDTGALDSTFASGGIYRSTAFDYIAGLALLPDGRILVSGGSLAGARVGRFLSNGTLDTGFGSGGISTTAPFRAGTNSFISGDAILGMPDGRVIVSGNESQAPTGAFVMRLNANGSFDTSFGNGGLFRRSGPEEWVRLAAQADGKILVGTHRNATGGYDIIVDRLTADGALDVGYGNSGTVLAASTGADEYSVGASVGPDGSLFLLHDTPTVGVLTKIRSDGSLDPNFGMGGAASMTGSLLLTALDVTADGRIYVADSYGVQNTTCGRIVRITPTGAIDDQWAAIPGQIGVTLCRAPANYEFTSMDIGPNGALLLSGSRWLNGDDLVSGAVVRLMP